MLRDLSFLQIALAAFGVGFLIAFHELGHYAAARLLGMRVIRYSLGFGKKVVGFTRSGIEYQLSMLPFGGYVQIAGMSTFDEEAKDDPRSYLNAPRWKRWLVLFAGPAFNYLAAFAFFFIYFAAWPSPTGAPAVEMVEVHEGAAQEAGLLRGEFITHINGAAVVDEASFRDAIIGSNGQAVLMTVLEADGEGSREVAVVPKNTEGGYKLGVAPTMRWPSAGFLATVEAAATNCYLQSKGTLMALGALVRRDPGVDVGGPIAIVADMKDKIAQGMRYFIMVLGMVSISLGVFNLLPIPGLDGIKMGWLTLEGLARRNVNLRFQEMVNVVGTLLLLVLMAGLTLRDGIRIFS